MTEDAPGTRGGASSARSEAIYQELILDHYRSPRNRSVLEDADVVVTHRNPLCGDELVVYLAMDGKTIREARFTGQGCAISQAAASMLTGALRGSTKADARALLACYSSMMQGDAACIEDPSLGDLRALAGVTRLPARVKCALLPADAFSRALDQSEER